jgi:hypothetical protein
VAHDATAYVLKQLQLQQSILETVVLPGGFFATCVL